VNWRVLGCGALAAAVFIGLGLWSLQLALGRPGCPPTLLWGDRIYSASGEPEESPVVGSGDPDKLGTILVGPISRVVYGPSGSAPSPNTEDRPDTIALECGDGTFVTYEFTDVVPTARPSP
jgi:hypothetical protein